VSGGLREQTAAAIRAHQERGLMNFDTGFEECRCGEQGGQDWPEHVADVLWRALGLTEERTTYAHTETKAVPGGQQSRYLGMRTSARWVSGWSVVDGEGEQ
jgi:hypothetical protein